MRNRRVISTGTTISYIAVAVLVIVGIYWAINAYAFTYGRDANAIAVAADASMATLALIGATVILLVRGLSTMNTHLENIEDAAQEQVKLLRFLAKQAQKEN